MAGASIDYFSFPQPIPWAYNQWGQSWINLPTNPLVRYVARRHLSLNWHIVKWVVLSELETYPDLFLRNRRHYDMIKTAIDVSNMPALVTLGTSRPGGHAVIAYAVTECADGRIVLSVYDPNKVLMLTGAYPALVEGYFTEDQSGLVVDSTSISGPNGEPYKDFYAAFAAPSLPLPQEPVFDPSWDSSALSQAMAEATNAGYVPDAMSLSETQLDQGGEPMTHQFPSDTDLASAVIVSWSGSSLRLEVYRPDDSLFAQVQGSQSPLIVEIPRGDIDGIWTYSIAAVSVPYDDYPCISLVGYRRHSCYLPLVVRGQ